MITFVLLLVGCVKSCLFATCIIDSLDNCRKAKRRFLRSHPDVTCFYTSKKIIGGEKTDQHCLVIGVRKKKKESELEEQWVLPKEIQHGWYRHLVDVIEEEMQLLGPQPMQNAVCTYALLSEVLL